MATEKYIRGKRDNAKHDGRYSNVKREQAAEYDQAVFEQLQISVAVYQQRDRLPSDVVSYHTKILIAWGLLQE